MQTEQHYHMCAQCWTVLLWSMLRWRIALTVTIFKVKSCVQKCICFHSKWQKTAVMPLRGAIGETPEGDQYWQIGVKASGTFVREAAIRFIKASDWFILLLIFGSPPYFADVISVGTSLLDCRIHLEWSPEVGVACKYRNTVISPRQQGFMGLNQCSQCHTVKKNFFLQNCAKYSLSDYKNDL